MTDRDADMHAEAHAAPAFRTGSDPREDAFVSVGDALQQVREDLGLPASDTFVTLLAHWQTIVGPDIAAHARLDSVRDGVAVVTADGPIWASQLRYLEQTVVDGANAVVGPGIVSEMRVRVEA